MPATALEAAVLRLEHAIVRLEHTPPATTSAHRDADALRSLHDRHERLRLRVGEAIAALDRLIDAG